MDGNTCTPDQLALGANPSTPSTCLNRGQSVGLLLVAETGTISLAAVLLVLAKIIHNAIKAKQWRVIKKPIEVFLLLLFVADAIQALGVVMSAKWVHDGIVQSGPYCRAQGLLQNFGEANIAINTIVIDIYTSVLFWSRKGHKSLVFPLCIVAITWTSTFLFVIISLTINKEHWRAFYGPTPYWCWIDSPYFAYRIAGEYLWVWLALSVSIICYIPLLFWGLRSITMNGPCWKFQTHPKRQGHPDEIRLNIFYIIAYPLAYNATVLPLSVVRWNQFRQHSMGHQVNVHTMDRDSFVVVSLFGLIGSLHVLLFFLTRRGLFTDAPVPDGVPRIASVLPSPRPSMSSFRVEAA